MPALWLMISSVGYQANPTCPVANPGTISLLRINIIRGNMCPVTIRGYLRPVAIRGYRCPVTLTTREKTQTYSSSINLNHASFIIFIHFQSIIIKLTFIHNSLNILHFLNQPTLVSLSFIPCLTSFKALDPSSSTSQPPIIGLLSFLRLETRF